MIPIEALLLELIYFLIVAGLSLTIYLKTRDIYNISRLKGIYHFRNIFLYFLFAYLFRLIYILLLLSEMLNLSFIIEINEVFLLLVGYFSSMAIFSVVMTIYSHKSDDEMRNLNNVMHIIAILLSVTAMFLESYTFLVIFQTVVFFAAILVIFFRKPRGRSFSYQNKITYMLLFIFWTLNMFAFTRNLIPLEFKLVLYLISSAIFLSIYLRLNKRLKNVQKRQT